MTETDPRETIRQRLEADLDEVDAADVRSGVFCAEMGCGEREQRYLQQHPDLGCPYMDRVENPSDHCERLQQEYRAATTR